MSPGGIFHAFKRFFILTLLISVLPMYGPAADEADVIIDEDDEFIIGEDDEFVIGENDEFIIGEDDEYIEEDDFLIEEDDIVIEGTGIEIPGLGEPGQSTVIERDELEAAGSRTVADILQRVPGVTVSRQGGGLETATISIRGSSADQVLVLVDGEKRNSLWGGPVNLNSLPIDRIESIEIIRGGGSALYGEGAIGGVLSITTRKAESRRPEISITAGIGSFETYSGSLSMAGGLNSTGSLTGRFFGEGMTTEGNYEYDYGDGDEVRGNNQGWSGSFSGGLEWESSDGNIDADLSFDGQFTDRGVPGLMEFLTPEAESSEESLGAGLGIDFKTSGFGLIEVSVEGSRRITAYKNPDEDLDDSHENLGGSLGFEWESPVIRSFIDFSGTAGLKGGADNLYSTGLTDSTGTALNGEARQYSGSAWGNVRMGSGNFILIPALRWDIFSQEYIGRDSIDRNAFSWSVTGQGVWKSISVEASGQTSYHNPSFQDLFWPAGAFASGNPDLLPEKGMGCDLGVTWQGFGDFSLTAGGYWQNVEDLIQWLPSVGGIWRPRNVGEALIYGAEASFRGIVVLGEDRKGLFPLFMEYQGGYDWLRCLDATEDSVNYEKQLAYRPEHSASGTLLFSNISGTTLEVSGTYQGLKYSNNANTKYFDPVFLLNASLRIFVTPSWEIGFSGKNLTNQEYIDKLGYPVPGIEWSVEGGFHY